jgi:hypothetical protein
MRACALARELFAARACVRGCVCVCVYVCVCVCVCVCACVCVVVGVPLRARKQVSLSECGAGQVGVRSVVNTVCTQCDSVSGPGAMHTTTAQRHPWSTHAVSEDAREVMKDSMLMSKTE